MTDTTNTVTAAVLYSDDNLLTSHTHPLNNLLVVGTVQGNLHLYEFTPPGPTHLVNSIKVLKDSCRCARFSGSGRTLYCGGKGKAVAVVDVATQKKLRDIKDAHSCPVNTLHSVSERLLATGDEDGCVKVWDTRICKEVMSVREHSDFISDMISKDSTVLCTSGDGSLSVLDMRKKGTNCRSDSSESELLCLSLVKDGGRVVTGNAEGVLGIFIWNLWGDIVERYPVLPNAESVDSLIQVSDSVLCAGGMDGKLRAVQILPNKTLGVVGSHSAHYAVDDLHLTHDSQYLVSSSYDIIRFWPISSIPTVWVEDSEDEGEGSKVGGARRKKKRKTRRQLIHEENKKSKQSNSAANFFSDL